LELKVDEGALKEREKQYQKLQEGYKNHKEDAQ